MFPFFLGLDEEVVFCVFFWFSDLVSPCLVLLVFLHFRFVSCGVNAGSMGS